MTRLTVGDHAFFRDNGYIVVPGVVAEADCRAVIAAIFAFLGMDPDEPEDWYRPPLTPGGMVEMYHHQSEWNNRQNPRLYEVFAELIGEPHLWVTIDRVNMKPPTSRAHPEYDHKGFIHWDVDTSDLSIPFWVQGVLCLADTDASMGGFQCIPGFHRNLEAWIATQPKARNPRVPDLAGLHVEPIPARAGDLIIWDRLLAHGNGQNRGSAARFAQYIAMRPADEANAGAREARIACWRERNPPVAPYFPGDSRRIEQSTGEPAKLTALGRKLLGLDAWGPAGRAPQLTQPGHN
ncbi:MAG: phytanoyl-CoA dioxygenase family protein [Armatimonadetes bacterium]|nr:phytanoyl-CoA dioxygenase family protein [Armatimonadota bacterium]MDE2206691.1 phytanoyl-CoA dioxygenase family protein [Armatimonadota bacterium]